MYKEIEVFRVRGSTEDILQWDDVNNYQSTICNANWVQLNLIFYDLYKDPKYLKIAKNVNNWLSRTVYYRDPSGSIIGVGDGFDPNN